ncbi:Ig-like domain-containing protein [Desulfurivibrio sp. C05AmB]|uniref:Ig-like domain-containing protein n=1 Tax=Desulfurivibrio sp. C05AmB TaxID=3374371 RepID=UPI00376EABEB
METNHWIGEEGEGQEPPTVTLTVPGHGNSGVALNIKVSATFSKQMAPATINSETFSVRQGTTVVAGTVAYTGVTAVFTPAANLAANTTYTATVTTGARDLAGTALAEDFVWSFTTGAALDTTAPTVILTVPGDGDSGVTINTKVSATFSEAMDPLTITTSTFTLMQGTNAVPGTLVYSGVTGVFTPDSVLDFFTTYTATVTTGAEDLAGNALAADHVWSFTTGVELDTTRPTVTLVEPADLATGVALNNRVYATFSEAMDPLTLTTATFTVTGAGFPIPGGTVSYAPLTKIATFAPLNDFAPDTPYTATITTGATDLAGNQLEGNTGLSGEASDYVWSFTTASEVLPPAAVNLGLASTFGIAATAGVTNTLTEPITDIHGDAVLNPNATCNAVEVDHTGGFGLCGGAAPTISGEVVTTQYPDTTTAQAVTDDLRAAYLALTPANMPGGTSIAAGETLGAPVGNALVEGDNLFYPGVYTSNTSILITGDLTLDAQGDPDASFVFQSASTIGTAPNARILLVGEAKASNVWWQVGSSATLGTNTIWQGNVLAYASVTMNTQATSCGRLFAGAFTDGAFVFDSNVVSVPGDTNAPSTCQ